MANSPLLDIRDLHTDIEIRSGVVHALSGVDLHVNPGETLGIVGESGSGKTMTALSLMGLLPQGGSVSSGQIILDGQDLTKLALKEKRKLRGTKVGMIFQDPLTSLNPTMKIGLRCASRCAFTRSSPRRKLSNGPSRSLNVWVCLAPRWSSTTTRTSSRAVCVSAS